MTIYGTNNRKFPGSLNGKLIREYAVWHSMVDRCYNPRVHSKSPSYIGCEVSDYFKEYSNFYEWWNKTPFSDRVDYSLDKDIIGNGKLYSENTCCFVPREINNLFILRQADRGELPLGVTRASGCEDRYVARLNVGDVREYLGIFSSKSSAYEAYKIAKERRVHETAEKYKGLIEDSVYDVLKNYELEVK